MVLRDITQKTLLTSKAKIAQSFSDRLFGLLDPQNPRFLIFYTHFGIHTLFMKTAIDVLLLNRNGQIVGLRKVLSPYRLFIYNPIYSTVIEMPPGTIRKCRLHINDKISIA